MKLMFACYQEPRESLQTPHDEKRAAIVFSLLLRVLVVSLRCFPVLTRPQSGHDFVIMFALQLGKFLVALACLLAAGFLNIRGSWNQSVYDAQMNV